MIAVKLFTDVPNVGDAVGARIIENIVRRGVRIIGEASSPFPNIIGIGSIAHWADRNSTLWGCGLISDRIQLSETPARVLALRGYLTHDILSARGIRCGNVIADPGLLLPDLIAPSTPRFDVGIVPHYVDRDSVFVERCRQEGIPVIDVFASPEEYVDLLTSCRRILSSSLHGIIFAHAYGIKAAWVRISDNVYGDGFKFRDYYSSLGIRPSDIPMTVPGQDTMDEMIGTCGSAGTLPNRDALRAALVEFVASVDPSTHEGASA